MNDVRFAELSKALSNSQTRRGALKLFGATAAGGFMTLAGAGRAWADARCYQGGHGCRENTECCSNFCDPLSTTCACARDPMPERSKIVAPRWYNLTIVIPVARVVRLCTADQGHPEAFSR